MSDMNSIIRRKEASAKYESRGYRAVIYYGCKNPVVQKGTLELIRKLWKGYTNVPYPKGACYIDIAVRLSHSGRYAYDKFHSLLTDNDARAILDTFYYQGEMDKGVYRKLLDKDNILYVQIAEYLKALDCEPLNLDNLSNPFIPVKFVVPKGTIINAT